MSLCIYIVYTRGVHARLYVHVFKTILKSKFGDLESLCMLSSSQPTCKKKQYYRGRKTQGQSDIPSSDVTIKVTLVSKGASSTSTSVQFYILILTAWYIELFVCIRFLCSYTCTQFVPTSLIVTYRSIWCIGVIMPRDLYT